MPKFIFIRGLIHSGTTILDFSLGSHSKFLGLGEAAKVLQTGISSEQKESRTPKSKPLYLDPERLCSCGKAVKECPVWESFAGDTHLGSNPTLWEKWNSLIRKVEENPEFTDIDYVVDSSPRDYDLLKQVHHHDSDLKVVYLIRDIRSWVHSKLAKTGDFSLWNCHKTAKEWKKGIRSLLVLKQLGVPIFTLSLEELALKPRESLTALTNWLGVDFEENMLKPSHSKSHMIEGNRIRKNLARIESFQYDGSWLASTFSKRITLATWPYLKLNQKMVYSNNLVIRQK